MGKIGKKRAKEQSAGAQLRFPFHGPLGRSVLISGAVAAETTTPPVCL